MLEMYINPELKSRMLSDLSLIIKLQMDFFIHDDIGVSIHTDTS